MTVMYNNFSMDLFRRLYDSLSLTNFDGVYFHIGVDSEELKNNVIGVITEYSGSRICPLTEVHVLRSGENLSLAQMRSALLKDLLGTKYDPRMTHYMFIDSDDYVKPWYFDRIKEQIDFEHDYFVVEGTSILKDGVESNRVWGGSHIYSEGVVPTIEDKFMSENLSAGVWAWILTRKCLNYFTNIVGSYEDTYTMLNIIQDKSLKGKIIDNVGYIYVNQSPSSILDTQKKARRMSMMDKYNYLTQIRMFLEYLERTNSPGARANIAKMIEYYCEFI